MDRRGSVIEAGMEDGGHRARSRAAAGVPTLENLLALLEMHDPYTAAHSRRVAEYAAHLAREVGLDANQADLIRRAGLAHDLGKLAIPHKVLTKRAGLSDDEFSHLQTHPAEGASLLMRVPGAGELVPIVLHHHEHWNGRGYPTGLTGVEIPLESRFILVADAYDAMTTTRPYDPKISPDAALMEIVHCSEEQFDPLVVSAIERAMENISTGRGAPVRALLL